MVRAGFSACKTFAKAFPSLARGRRVQGSQKQPTKVAVSLRLTREVVERFKADGPGGRRVSTKR
jgi:uncharacterized protein (DUF4415 family)